MQTINVRTTQNVYIQYPVASLGDRILAYLIDYLIIVAYVILCIFLLVAADASSIAIILSVIFLPIMFYHLVFEIFMNGQSPGKRQMNIKVVRLDGTPPTIGSYLLRWLIRIIEIDLLSGAIAMITIAANGKGQRLGDMAAGTAVVKLMPQQATSSKDLFTIAEEQYTPIFQQVTLLNDQDIEIIQQALAVNRESGNIQPVMAVTDKIKSLLNIQTDLPPVKFLYTVLKDYSHLTARL
jgi:uncharacterized RDD family membrane protein YckC